MPTHCSTCGILTTNLYRRTSADVDYYCHICLDIPVEEPESSELANVDYFTVLDTSSSTSSEFGFAWSELVGELATPRPSRTGDLTLDITTLEQLSNEGECNSCGGIGTGRVRVPNVQVEHMDGTFCGETQELCQSCSRRLRTCSGCSQLTRHPAGFLGGRRADDTSPIPQFCGMCYSDREVECGQCGELSPMRDIAVYHWVEDSGMSRHRAFCPDCVDMPRANCGACDRVYDIDLRGCPHCGRRNGTSLLQNYSYRPPVMRFYATDAELKRNPSDDTRLSLGWELEVEVPDTLDNLNTLLREVAAPWLYAKSDSSINYGFELVSHPMTLGWMHENKVEITKRLRKLIRMGCKSHNTTTCGTHFHLTKEAFGSLQLFKFQALIYLNPGLTLTVSQRAPERLEYYSSLTKENLDLLARKSRRKTGNMVYDSHTRRVAVNLEPENTVELRFFRGNLRPDRFFKNAEYCVAAFEFSRDYGITDMTESAFRLYVAAHTRRFPHLAQFLHDFGSLGAPASRGELEELVNDDGTDSDLVAEVPRWGGRPIVLEAV